MVNSTLSQSPSRYERCVEIRIMSARIVIEKPEFWNHFGFRFSHSGVFVEELTNPPAFDVGSKVPRIHSYKISKGNNR